VKDGLKALCAVWQQTFMVMHGKGEIAGPCLTQYTFSDNRQRQIARNRFD
jgi:hypothetical protein